MKKETSNRVLPQTGGKVTVNPTAKTLVRNCRSTVAVPVSVADASKQNPGSVSSESASSTAVKSRRNVASKNNPGSASESASSTAAKSGINVNTNDEVTLENPRLHSLLKVKETLDKMKAGMKSVRFEQNAPPEQRSQVSRKVNIRFDERIYKDLIDLKVTEEDLRLRPITNSKPKELTKPRDPVPVLADFYVPKFDKEYVVKPHPPSWSQTFQSFKRPDQRKRSSVLDAVKRWSVDDKSLY